jgi:hypothetical protein
LLSPGGAEHKATQSRDKLERFRPYPEGVLRTWREVCEHNQKGKN